MPHATIEVGAFTWTRIQRLFDPDPEFHWRRCESEGLECPQEVFTQLFHEHSSDADFAVIVRSIDWGRVHWELEELSGIALRQVRVERGYQYAVDEARDRATRFGVEDERQEVIDHWQEAKSWIVPPVALECSLLDGGPGLELVVGYTRLGNLLALLDREAIPETKRHLLWVGYQMLGTMKAKTGLPI
jgi:hypothetical protein